MAWVAQLVQAVQKPLSDLSVMAEFVYYDDQNPYTGSNPEVLLHRHTFFFAPQTSGADMLSSVRAEGATARSAYTKAVSLAAGNPVGSTFTIP